MKTTSLFWLLAFVAGALIPVQAAANAALSKSLQGNVAFAALTLFVVAGAVSAGAALLAGGQMPTAAALRAAPWWSYLGGVIVAFYVFTITFLAPRLGVGTAISLIVAGQIVAALKFPLTPTRLVGAVLMAVGVFLALRR